MAVSALASAGGTDCRRWEASPVPESESSGITKRKSAWLVSAEYRESKSDIAWAPPASPSFNMGGIRTQFSEGVPC